MPKYYSDDQTLIVSGRPIENSRLCFFAPMEGQGWVMLVIVASVLIAFVMHDLLAYLKVWSWLKASSDSIGCLGIIFVATLSFALMRFWDVFYRTEISVKRDGRITRSTRVLGRVLNTRTFEKDHYRFLVEESHQEVYSGPEDVYQSGTWNAYRMSLVDESGGQFALFIVPEYNGIKEFEKFSDFTGFTPKLLGANNPV